jgi:hypothetical protein
MPEQPIISIDDITLECGWHRTAAEGRCFMEATAFIAREKHSDHPVCVCPVFGNFARHWNDYLKSKDRQKMKPYIRLAIGTAGDGFGWRRSLLIIDWSVREVLAVYCEAQNLKAVKDFARELRGLPEIADWASAKEASKVLQSLDVARRGPDDAVRAVELAMAVALHLAIDLAIDLAPDLALDPGSLFALSTNASCSRDLALSLFPMWHANPSARRPHPDLDRKKIVTSGFALMDRMVMLGLQTETQAIEEAHNAPTPVEVA